MKNREILEPRTKTDAVREYIAQGLNAAESAEKLRDEFPGVTVERAKGIYSVTKSYDQRRLRKQQVSNGVLAVLSKPEKKPYGAKSDYIHRFPLLSHLDLARKVAKEFGITMKAAKMNVYGARRKKAVRHTKADEKKAEGYFTEQKTATPTAETATKNPADCRVPLCPRCGLNLEPFHVTWSLLS